MLWLINKCIQILLLSPWQTLLITILKITAFSQETCNIHTCNIVDRMFSNDTSDPLYRSTIRDGPISWSHISFGSTDQFLKSHRYLRADHVLSSRDGLSGSLILGTDRSSRASPPANSPTPLGWFASRLRARSSSWWLYYRGSGMRTCWKNRDGQRYLSRAYHP